MVEKFLVDKMDDQPSHKKPKLGSSGSFDDLEAFKELNRMADIPDNPQMQMQQNGVFFKLQITFEKKLWDKNLI